MTTRKVSELPSITTVSDNDLLLIVDTSDNASKKATVSQITSGVVAGSNTQIQFNSAGSLSASSNLTWTSASSTLGITGNLSLANKFIVDNTGRITKYENIPPLDGQILIGTTTGGYYTPANISSGTGVSIDNGGGSITINLGNTTVSPDSYGSASQVGTFTVDPQGRLTAAASTSISITASQVSDFDVQVRSNRLDQMTAPTTSVSMNNHKVTNLADPTLPNDAVNKAYVDSTSQGLDVKASCHLATVAPLPDVTYANGSSGFGATLTASAVGALSVDGDVVALNDRILVKDQASAFQNGIYTVTTVGTASVAFVLTRATDMDQASDFAGAFTFVESGSVNADNGFVCTTSPPITLGTTDITFSQFSGAGQIIAGEGLSKTGNTIELNVDSRAAGTKTTTIVSDEVRIDSQWSGQTTLTTLGTVTTGTWNANTIDIGFGGTGHTTASAAFGALSPLTTKGDLLAFGSANTRVPVGTNGQVLTADSAQASGLKWTTPTGGTVTSVDLSTTLAGIEVGGAPVTGSGTLTLSGTLGVTSGGTGTNTQFTPGSVVFAGTSGVYSQNNSNLFWDSTNSRFGIGGSSPIATFDARINSAQEATPGYRLAYLGTSSPTGLEPGVLDMYNNGLISIINKDVSGDKTYTLALGAQDDTLNGHAALSVSSAATNTTGTKTSQYAIYAENKKTGAGTIDLSMAAQLRSETEGGNNAWLGALYYDVDVKGYADYAQGVGGYVTFTPSFPADGYAYGQGTWAWVENNSSAQGYIEGINVTAIQTGSGKSDLVGGSFYVSTPSTDLGYSAIGIYCRASVEKGLDNGTLGGISVTAVKSGNGTVLDGYGAQITYNQQTVDSTTTTINGAKVIVNANGSATNVFGTSITISGAAGVNSYALHLTNGSGADNTYLLYANAPGSVPVVITGNRAGGTTVPFYQGRLGVGLNNPSSRLHVHSLLGPGEPVVTIQNNTSNWKLYSGTSSPQNSIAATVGSVFSDATNGVLYFKQSGSSTSGWVSFATTASGVTDFTNNEVLLGSGTGGQIKSTSNFSYNTSTSALTISGSVTQSGGAVSFNSSSVQTTAVMTISSSASNWKLYAGTSSPQNVVTSTPGSLFSDTTNGLLYSKNTGTGTSGWMALQGAYLTTASPEGAVVGSVGDLSKDTTNGVLYIKQSGTQTNTGWTKVGTNVTGVQTLTPSALVTIDLATALSTYKQIALNQNTAFITANLGAGLGAVVKITCDATARSLSFPATWTWLGQRSPVGLQPNQIGYLSIIAYGTTNNEVIAAWAESEQPATGSILPINTISSAQTLSSTQYTVLCDTTTSGFTATLPTAVGLSGRLYVIKNIGTNTVTVQADGSETIDGSNTYLLTAQWQKVTVQSNGISWFVV